MNALDIWMNGIFVGQWHQNGRTASRLVYAPTWVSHPQGRPLSLSLPMTGAGDGLRGAPVDNYFDNLLPDNETIRRRIGAQWLWLCALKMLITVCTKFTEGIGSLWANGL